MGSAGSGKTKEGSDPVERPSTPSSFEWTTSHPPQGSKYPDPFQLSKAKAGSIKSRQAQDKKRVDGTMQRVLINSLASQSNNSKVLPHFGTW